MSLRPHRLVFLVLAALLLPAAAEARTAPPAAPPTDTLRLTLDDAVRLALTHSEELRAARASVQQTQGQVYQAMSRALPQISGTILYDRKLESVFSGMAADTGIFGAILKNSSFAAEHAWTVDLTAQQLLWSSGKVGAALKGAKEANQSARANEQETISDLTFRVRRAYCDAAYLQRLVEIAESSLDQARAHLTQVRAGRLEGSRSEYEQLRAEVDASNQEPAVLETRSAAELARLALKRLTNLPMEQPLVLVTQMVDADGTVPVVTDLSTEVDERPGLAAADHMVEARRLAVKLYKGQYWPDLYVSTDVSHVAYPSDPWPSRSEFRRNWDAFVRIDVPIFNGLLTHGQVVEASAEYERAKAARDLAWKDATIEAVQARDEIERTQTALLARRETVRQAQRAWELAGVRYKNGMATQLEVSDARLQLRSAEANQIQAGRDYLVAIAHLERAVGHPLRIERRPLSELTPSSNPEGSR